MKKAQSTEYCIKALKDIYAKLKEEFPHLCDVKPEERYFPIVLKTY